MQLPEFTPKVDWKPPHVLPSWEGAKRIAIDIETCDPDLKKYGPGVRTNGFIAGVAFAIEDGPAHYLPIRHYLGGNMDEEKVLTYLRNQAAVFKGEVVGANLQYDMDYLAEKGILFDGVFRDVQVAEPLLDELQFSYSLENISRRYGLRGKDENLLNKFASIYGVDPKAGLWQLPAKAVATYAMQDVRLPLRLLRLQERKLDRQELWPIYDTECRLQKVLLKMRRRGVRIDFRKLDQIDQLSTKKELEALAEIKRLTGISLGIPDTTKTALLVPVAKAAGIPVAKTEKGNDSLTNDYLANIEHPVAEQIRQARKWNKLRGTFVASIQRLAVGDRIHCTFNQMIGEDESGDGSETDGARYGRLSCKNPNLQQQPARDAETGPLWRQIYVPDEGGEWACLDYSQQEPRWLTHYAELLKLDRAKEAAEKYRNDPTTDNHQMMADLCQIPRKEAKIIYLALCYGMGGGKMCTKLGLPTEWKSYERGGKKISYLGAGEEGQKLIEAFNAGAPFVMELAKRCESSAKRKGYIRTAGGRRCRFPELGRNLYDWCHKALNRLIQGSSGDQMKMALVDLDIAGCSIQLTVHDEVDLTVGGHEEAERWKQIMLDALPSNIPAKVDVEIGPSWGEIE